MLNTHSFSVNLTESDQCLCSRTETVSHYSNNCFLYQEERCVLLSKIIKFVPKFDKLPDYKKTEVLLNGINLNSDEPDSRNIPITLAVQNFILQTKRFK